MHACQQHFISASNVKHPNLDPLLHATYFLSIEEEETNLMHGCGFDHNILIHRIRIIEDKNGLWTVSDIRNFNTLYLIVHYVLKDSKYKINEKATSK